MKKLIIVGIATIFILFFALNIWNKHSLRNFGIKTSGIVKNVNKISYYENERSHRQIEYYVVQVEFLVNNKPVLESTELTTSEFQIDFHSLKTGDSVKIVYKESRPREFLVIN
jgi:hypothetical protein